MGAVRSEIAGMSRDHVLDEAAHDAARAWVRQWMDDLAREGRPVEGGWPGTLKEARGRCAELSTRMLARSAMVAPARDELDRITQITYAEARRLWRAA